MNFFQKNFIGRTGKAAFSASVAVTRPANTTQYAAGDAVSDKTSDASVVSIDLKPYGAIAGHCIQLKRIAIAASTKAGTLPQFWQWVLNETYAPTDDNSALILTDANIQSKPHCFSLATQFYSTLNALVTTSAPLDNIVKLADSSTTIYLPTQAQNAYTPGSAERFDIIVEGILL